MSSSNILLKSHASDYATTETKSLNHFLADDQLTKAQILELISLAIEIKQNPKAFNQALAGKTIAMIFENPP